MSSSGIPVMNTTAMFYEQYEAVRRDEVVGILLALFLGTFGIHHFYLRRTGLGILYCVFCWTGIPSILGFIECFFMPARVREFNAIQAAGIAAALGMPGPPGWGWPTPAAAPAPMVNPATTLPPAGLQIICNQCGTRNVAGARFCSGCGRVLETGGTTNG